MRKLITLLAAVVLLCSQSLAQGTRTITGKVTDEKGVPLVGVTITAPGSEKKALTDEGGNFTITVPEKVKNLRFSYVGFGLKEVAITGKTAIAVSMTSEDATINEVVVTGYTSEKKKQFTGAAAVLDGKVVNGTPMGAFDQALQGRAPGMQVSSGSGQPGTSANISIRGITSISGAFVQPLFIVDGVPLPAGDMQTINPNDFETITVLKDASAAALYGARGALGVIVITTKKGKAGINNFTYRTQMGITKPPSWNDFDMMNTSEILQYEERLKLANNPGWTYSKNNPAYAGLPATSPVGNPYAASQARYDFMLDSIGKINMDYTDILFRDGFSQNHEVNFTGGSDRTNVFISAGYYDQEGIDLTSKLKRYTTRINMGHTIDKLSIQWNNAMGYSKTVWSEGEWQGNSARNSFQMAWRAKPYENPYKPDGSLNFGPNTTLALKQIANVLEGMENTVSTLDQIKINTGLTLAYKVLPYLTVKNTLGIDVSDERHQRWIRPSSYIGSLQANGNRGFNAEAYRINTQIINTTAAIFNKRIKGIHEVEAGAFFEVVRGYQKALGFQIWNLDPRLELTGQGAGPLPVASPVQQGSSAKSGYGIRSYFGTAKYTYANKYTINANIRRDGTSRIMNEDNKQITTWSVGAIWNTMEESFMKKQTIFTDVRVRASYGQLPNIGSIGTGSYGVSGGLVSVTNYLGQQVPSFGSTTYAGSSLPGQAPTSPGNSELKMETNEKINIGLDLAMWRNRARITLDFYKNSSNNLFINNPLPFTAGTGGSSIQLNAGAMYNKGIEMNVAVDVLKKSNIEITVGFNHAINKNEITSLGQLPEISVGTFIHRVGLPYGSHYATNYLGADPTTGAPRFEKLDGTVTTDPAQAGLFAKFGTFVPKHVGGFNADFLIMKRFTVAATFSYQLDVQRYNNIENWVTRGIGGYHSAVNASRRLLTQQWQKPGDNAFYQGPAFDRGFSSSDIMDAKFLRFRNLMVAYDVPKLAIGKINLIKSARVYVQGQNLAIWSPWRGPDPEDNNNISLNEYPNPKMFVAGIDIKF